jgi:acetyltransferase-like isoleucine patch superfamily enzyme
MWFKDFARRGLRRLRTELAVQMHYAQAAVAERTMPRFANEPRHLIIDLPRRIINAEKISFGDDVRLGPGCFIIAVKEYPPSDFRHPGQEHETRQFAAHIHIGHRVSSSGNLVIGAAQEIEIGDDVMFAANVTVLDNLHGFEHPYQPYKYQPLQKIAPVRIGRGCWIGENVVILPGVEIGEMSIVGANSVVNRGIPERSIAVGAPARVVKHWDETAGAWRPFPRPAKVGAHFR